MILTIDFETYDPYIDRGLGSGWVYGLNVKGSDFRVLGVSIKIDDAPSTYLVLDNETREEKLAKLFKLLDEAELVIMHNAAYDLGCLEYLGYKVRKLTIYDTEIAGKLHDSALESHSLDNLSNKYLGHQKATDLLAEQVLALNIYPTTIKYKKELGLYSQGKGPAPFIDMKKVSKWCLKHMDLMHERFCPTVAAYANQDTNLTYGLYKYFLDKVEQALVLKFSKTAQVTTTYRKNGVRVDLDAARSAQRLLQLKLMSAKEKLFNIAGQEFNISSIKEVPMVLHECGLEPPRTANGNFSATQQWLESQDHPVCKALVHVRKLTKIKNDFIEKILDMQEFTCPESSQEGRYGRVYPELHLLRARTGRFSCSSPNIQQIPSRDEDLSPLCRGIFVADEGEKLFSLDYSNQEGRLQVHYASLLGCTGASFLKVSFQQDPKLDMHQQIADQMRIDRRTAKTINLGLSYGMGAAKLARQLDVDTDTAKNVLMKNYFDKAPWLLELKQTCENKLKKSTSIRTLGGRELKADPPMFVEGKRRTFEYKALNKLIQGSAADQTIEAMLQAYDEGIPVLFPVHDQLLMSGTREQAERLKDIMENCIKLEIPVVVDVNLEGGQSWLEAGH